jgi:LTXXQ motif family protein
MKDSRIAFSAIVLASVMALATPMTAQAFGRGGGGGGGGHFGGGGGGGHFGGGGGGHFGGGGGGFHLGGGGFHPGGGGMHLGGGGGGMRLGGFRLGGGGGGLSHLGGGHIGGLRVGNLHTGSLSRQALHPGNALQGGRSFANLHGLSRTHGPLATRVGPGFSRRAFMHDGFRHFGHDGFGHFRRFALFGWVGPLFWPYAYSDIYCDIFWGYWGYGCADPYWSTAYGNPFWDYGYSDIYGGLFSPFAFNDLAPYLANGPSTVRRGRSNGTPSEAIAQMCGDDTKEVAGWPIDRIQQLVSPDDQQRMALDDLANASMQAAQIIKTGCPTSVAFTPTGRLAAMQQRIEAMEQAVGVVRGPLERFYGALTDEQKAKLNSANQPPAQQNGRQRERGLAQSCATANTAVQWPEARIEAAVRPNETQQAKLKALQGAATQAAEQLAASCPAELPTTPTARLAAVSKRLDVMLGAVKTVRSALDDLYSDLNDEQKAQFNRIGQSRTAER